MSYTVDGVTKTVTLGIWDGDSGDFKALLVEE
jgi:hypothetical protein